MGKKSDEIVKKANEEEHCNMYEEVRARRIKENLEKMKQLGLNPLSRNILPAKKSSVKVLNKKPLLPSFPCRASPRLKMKIGDNDGIQNDKGERPKEHAKHDDGSIEVYTSEHVKLLGDCIERWPLLEDENVKRFYDPINGVTCHQCRQKTLGLRTKCNVCHRPHGRLCGNCLYTRYGENLLEAKFNKNWACPVCRGICNCSCCRVSKGWPPTGPIYDQVQKLGYNSVAHYLVLTRRSDDDTHNAAITK